VIAPKPAKRSEAATGDGAVTRPKKAKKPPRHDTLSTVARPPASGFLLGREPAPSTRTRFGFAPDAALPDQGIRPGALIFDRGEGHAAVIAPTGTGKSLNILDPTLLETEDSVIAVDVKGELARTTSRYRRDVLKQKVHIFDVWRCVTTHSAQFNPVDMLDPDSDTLEDDVYSTMAQFYQVASLKDPYWDGRAHSANAGILCHIVTSPLETDRSLGRLWEIVHSDDLEFTLATMVDSCPDMHPYARAQITALLSVSANETRSCIISTMRQHLRVLGSSGVRRALASTSFDLQSVIDGKPMTIYFVIPPDKLASHGTLLRLWISSLMTLMTRRKRPPQVPTLLLLDEVAQLGRMEELSRAVTLMRGYGLRCMLMLQSYAQLRALYPAEHEVLIENCGTIVTFGHTSLGMSHQIEAFLGDISAEALFGMRDDELAIRLPRSATRIVKRVDYVQDPEFAGRFDLDFRYLPRT